MVKKINDENFNIVNILIVDDSVDNVLSVESILEDINDINILKAYSGEEALKITLTEHIDILLTDVRMPGISGFEVAELLRGRKLTKDIPIIFISGEGIDQNHVFKGYEIGAVDYILKPFEPIVLKSKVQVFVNFQKQHKRINQLIESQSEINLEISNKNKILNEEINKRDLFYSIVAHDIRSPLAGIIGLITNLIDEKESDVSEIFYGLELIQKSTKSLEEMLENLLMWSKSQSSYLQPCCETILVSDVMKRIFDDLKVHTNKKRIELNYDFSFNPKIKFDKNMFTVVMRNLIGNAIKFSGMNSHIDISVTQNKINTIIAIQDYGIGMNHLEKKNIFDIEKRHKKVGTTGEKGSGLGLLVCKEFIEKNNGTISLESEEKIGTTFFITLLNN